MWFLLKELLDRVRADEHDRRVAPKKRPGLLHRLWIHGWEDFDQRQGLGLDATGAQLIGPASRFGFGPRDQGPRRHRRAR
jgi:hypothetical protein